MVNMVQAVFIDTVMANTGKETERKVNHRMGM